MHFKIQSCFQLYGNTIEGKWICDQVYCFLLLCNLVGFKFQLQFFNFVVLFDLGKQRLQYILIHVCLWVSVQLRMCVVDYTVIFVSSFSKEIFGGAVQPCYGCHACAHELSSPTSFKPEVILRPKWASSVPHHLKHGGSIGPSREDKLLRELEDSMRENSRARLPDCPIKILGHIGENTNFPQLNRSVFRDFT